MNWSNLKSSNILTENVNQGAQTSEGSHVETPRRDSNARRPAAETLLRAKHHENTKRLEKRKSQSRK